MYLKHFSEEKDCKTTKDFDTINELDNEDLLLRKI